MVDCRGGAPQFPHLKHRLKRREMERLRSQEIDTENMILLHKMRSIFRDGTVATNSGLPKPVEVLPRSLNQEARRRELERISRENLEIVQRIRASKPCYSATKQLSDQQEREAILKRISRHGRRRLDVFSPSSSTASLLSSGTLGSSSRSITALGRSRSMATQLMSYYEPQAGGPQYGDELGEPSAASSMLNVDEFRPTPMRLKPLPGGGKGNMALGKMAPASADSMPPPPPPPPMHVGDKPRTPLYAARPEPSPVRGPSVAPAPAPAPAPATAPAPAAPTKPAARATAPAAPTAAAPTAPTATAPTAPVPAAPEAAAAAAVAAAAVAAAVTPPAAAPAATPAPAPAAVEPPAHAVNVAIDFQDSSRPQSRGLQLKLDVPDGVGPTAKVGVLFDLLE